MWQWQIETWMNNLEKKVYHWKLQEVEQNACAAVELWKLFLQIDTYYIAQDLHKKPFSIIKMMHISRQSVQFYDHRLVAPPDLRKTKSRQVENSKVLQNKVPYYFGFESCIIKWQLVYQVKL